jgi:predicted permease
MSPAALGQDFRFAARALRRSPGLALVAVASLALGIGGNATIFSLVNGLLLKPLPVAEPVRTLAIYTGDFSGSPYGTSSYPDYLDFRQRLPAFDRIVALNLHPTSLTTPTGTSRIFVGMVSSDFFSGLGIPLALGRSFAANEDQPPAGEAVVVLSHATWTTRFGADPTILGKVVQLGGHPFVVIGVGAKGFTGITRGIGQDGWVPLTAVSRLKPGATDLVSRGNRSLFLFGHLAAGASLEQAEAQSRALSTSLLQEHPDHWRNLQGRVRPITLVPESKARLIFPGARGPILGVSGLLFLVVGAVLLIACANVANLFLARMVAHRREIAVRLALGATRGRLVQHVLAESTLIAVLGGALGLLLASWVADLISTLRLPLPVPLALDLSPDARVLGFTLIVSLAAGLGLGLGPALQATRPQLVPALKDEGGAALSPRSRLRGAFVVSQCVLSLLLLVVAGLFVRSLRNASSIDPGFSAEHALLVTTDLGLNGYDSTRAWVFQQQLMERAGALPGVQSAALVTEMPLGLGGSRQGLSIQDYAPAAGEDMEVSRTIVGPGYFETLQVPIVRGRSFNSGDREGAPGVAIVNEAFARRYWPGQDPLGRRLSVGGPDDPGLEVVGIAKDGKYETLGEQPKPFFYLPLSQRRAERTTLILKTRAEPRTIASLVQAVVHQLDPNLPIESVSTLTEHLAFSLLPARLGGIVLGGFGLLGLILASLGIYGIVAFGVNQRRREIGIRIALGATHADVVGLAVKDGMTLVGVGLAIGLLAAAAAARFLRGLLYGLEPLDPQAFLAAPLLFGLVALGASWFPARRAARVDPMVAMRAE